MHQACGVLEIKNNCRIFNLITLLDKFAQDDFDFEGYGVLRPNTASAFKYMQDEWRILANFILFNL